MARLKRAREEGVDPDDLRDEDEEGGFKRRSIGLNTENELTFQCSYDLQVKQRCTQCFQPDKILRPTMKLYQMVNTFRYETKQTRSFIRVRNSLLGAHTAHADEECATRQIQQDLEIVDNLMHDLCLPIISKEAVWDIPVRGTIGIDAIMPNGRTSKLLRTTMQRPGAKIDVTYENLNAEQQHPSNNLRYVRETLGAVVGMHGDDNGLNASAIAPHQIVICPMIRKNSEVDTIAKSEE